MFGSMIGSDSSSISHFSQSRHCILLSAGDIHVDFQLLWMHQLDIVCATSLSVLWPPPVPYLFGVIQMAMSTVSTIFAAAFWKKSTPLAEPLVMTC
jgi:hypothetical protein